MNQENHEKWMRYTLVLAEKTDKSLDVPIAAIIVKDNQIISEAFNQKEVLKDPTAHAEILAIRQAGQKLGAWRLEGCTMYVSLEPCAMCAGAVVNARLDTIVYATPDPKGGGVISKFQICNGSLNHQPEIISGILQNEAEVYLKTFFQDLRKK